MLYSTACVIRIIKRTLSNFVIIIKAKICISKRTKWKEKIIEKIFIKKLIIDFISIIWKALYDLPTTVSIQL